MSEGAIASEEVAFDPDAFSMEAIKRASYKFASEFTISIRQDSKILCKLEFEKKLFDDTQRAQIIRRFKTEVLDQDLREKIARETEQVRNLILAHAFSQTGLQDDG